MTTSAIDPLPPRDLGGGLLLRAATAADADALAAFNAKTHAVAPSLADTSIAAWTRDLLERPHPTFRAEMFTIVEERASGKIVSSLNLLPQTWSFGGIPIGMGQIELVGTDPDYRRRGLVRTQMEVAHGWSARLGHLFQAISGIPWYYRQFGYEMALEMDASHRIPVANLPDLAEGESEPYRLRPAVTADIGFLAETDAHGRQRWLVSAIRDEAIWAFELAERTPDSVAASHVMVIEPTGEAARPAGYVVHDRDLWNGSLWVRACELSAGGSWLAVAPSLLRLLRDAGAAMAGDDPAKQVKRVALGLGTEHPLSHAAGGWGPDIRRPYAWFVRVPDLPAFLWRIQPILERRLAASPAVAYTGVLKLNLYRGGLMLTFSEGRLTAIEPWATPDFSEAEASFPPLTLLHLLFGHRSLAEVEAIYPDCYVPKHEARVVLESLFPRLPSRAWAIE